MFALLMELYAMMQVSILLSVISQMGRNVAPMFHHGSSKFVTSIRDHKLILTIKITYIVQGIEIYAKSATRVGITRDICTG